MDHLVLYRPGAGIIWILKNDQGAFRAVLVSNNGIGTPSLHYDLLSARDQLFAYDFSGTGQQDHLAAYRPGAGIIWVFENNSGTFNADFISNSGPLRGMIWLLPMIRY